MTNFSTIENLTNEQIFEIYDDVIEGNSYTATNYGCLWEVRCANGNDGYFLDYRPLSDEVGCKAHDPFYHCYMGDSLRTVCGYGVCGTATGVETFTLDNPGTYGLIWKVTCTTNRNTGYFFDYRPQTVKNETIGNSVYGCYNFLSVRAVCGESQCGVVEVHTIF